MKKLMLNEFDISDVGAEYLLIKQEKSGYSCKRIAPVYIENSTEIVCSSFNPTNKQLKKLERALNHKMLCFDDGRDMVPHDLAAMGLETELEAIFTRHT
jgi:hypothetical protein